MQSLVIADIVHSSFFHKMRRKFLRDAFSLYKLLNFIFWHYFSQLIRHRSMKSANEISSYFESISRIFSQECEWNNYFSFTRVFKWLIPRMVFWYWNWNWPGSIRLEREIDAPILKWWPGNNWEIPTVNNCFYKNG